MLFRCRADHCKKMFKKSCNLRDHFRTHTGIRPFSCKHCKKTFTQKSNCKRHMATVHGNDCDSDS